MSAVRCPAFPAWWVNAWLAGVGATVLDPRLRLAWTLDATPMAVFAADNDDPVEILAAAWPSAKALEDLPIARDWGETSVLERKVPVDDFVARAKEARKHPQSWTLSSTLTDLAVNKAGEAAHAPLDPAGPGTVKWLHHRLKKVHRHATAPSMHELKESLLGNAGRVKDNGLGFDQTRLGSLSDDTEKWVDPIIEVLAFFGLALFPVRGPGIDARDRNDREPRALQRQWKRVDEEGNRQGNTAHALVWPAWSQPLDQFGIDALLDIWRPNSKEQWKRIGIHAGWKITPYNSRDRADATRAFGSERL